VLEQENQQDDDEDKKKQATTDIHCDTSARRIITASVSLTLTAPGIPRGMYLHARAAAPALLLR
jgi:hypothetical protein